MTAPTPPHRAARRPSARESGQAVVETAIVMPLFVFVLLGLFQLSLMHQARLMTKYAAYKAARAGSLSNAKHSRMEMAALAVLLPMVSHQRTVVSGSQRAEAVFQTRDTGEFLQAFTRLGTVQRNIMFDGFGLNYVEVRICSPTKQLLGNNGGQEVSFDDVNTNGYTGLTWEGFDRTRLAVQVTFNYRMPIPFANMMLWWIARGQEQATLMQVTRTGFTQSQHGQGSVKDAGATYELLARTQGLYVLPIRAEWSMRMQSDFFPNSSGYELPQDNECQLRFAKR